MRVCYRSGKREWRNCTCMALSNTKDVEGRIDSLLFCFWDPMGINSIEGAGPRKQYRRYAKVLANDYRESNIDLVFAYLKEVYVKCLGVEARNWDHTFEAANLVCAILEERFNS